MKSNHDTIKSPGKWEAVIIRLMIIIGVLTIVNFLIFFFRTEFKGCLPLYLALAIILLYGALKKMYLWYHYFSISVPAKVISEKIYEVDVLTTYFPGEPYDMILKTLEAIQNITYPHTTYLCDEANDPYLKTVCERLGVIHRTRDNRINAKAGNINSTLKVATGEICLILDPDHIPVPGFLDVVLPHFNKTDIGFVQTVQAYYNKPFTLVARGGAEQTFQFYGPMMMSMNSYGTVNAIGANCVFRRKALDSIGGHAPGLAEDMHTAMLLHAQGWKSVYIPKILAKGLTPPELTSYYKQQLKWSRGTFELLYKVYPKTFKHFTWRQKIHYALLPLHYLIGFIYLLSFLIPMGSLFLSRTPWTGNIVYFILMSLPVFMSSLLIRTFIQKWVIEKNERGFHLIGGLLQIITWWVFILGVVYTFLRKNVPYLPTPKSEDEENNFRIVVPNLIVGVLSLIAIIYGLNQDFTPFSLVMAFFALLNALFMFFSIYLVAKVTNRNRILRTALEHKTIDLLKEIKKFFGRAVDFVFTITRTLALPLLLVTLFLSNAYLDKMEEDKWNDPNSGDFLIKDIKYLGAFYPTDESGSTNLESLKILEREKGLNFQINSFYIPWGDQNENYISDTYLQKIKESGAVPMMTWEPWASGFNISDSIPDLKKEQRMLHYIQAGYFDAYITEMALQIKKFKNPFFIRFAHEFDNPAYPWSTNGDNTPEDYRRAWRHVYSIFAGQKADNVIWVWNPWKPQGTKDYYPGDAYVNWLGITLLNYGKLNTDGQWHSFESLYAPYHESFKMISKKPIMLAEFGSLALGGEQHRWLQNAYASIDMKYDEIKGLVFFYSKFDKNIPKNSFYDMPYLDWTFSFQQTDSFSFFRNEKIKLPDPDAKVAVIKNTKYKAQVLSKTIRGVGYSKGDNWTDNNYVANKMTLEKDFEQMRQLGINLLKCQHDKIYDYNILKYSKEQDLDLVYSFWIPSTINFIEDHNTLDSLQSGILKRITELKVSKNIVGWTITNDLWTALGWQYDHAKANRQRQAYLHWIKELLSQIKKIDPDRWVTKEVDLSQLTTQQLDQINILDMELDAVSLMVKDNSFLDEVLSYLGKNEMTFMVDGISAAMFNAHRQKFANTPVILSNWQNRWESHSITYDGLFDFNGRPKWDYSIINANWGDGRKKFNLPKISILRPAIPIFPNRAAMYYALYEKDNSWLAATDEIGIFEWRLAKKDQFGNVIAIEKMGQGISLELVVPNEPERYEIVLTMVKDEFSRSLRSSLKTPLHAASPAF